MSIRTRLGLWFEQPRPAHGRKGQQHRVQLHVEELETRRLLSAFYVSPAGNDSNPGTSPSAAWQTINRVNQAAFQAGDQILFQGGATFSGDLTLTSQDTGTAASPITISSYGAGPATINAGTGTGISAVDTQGVTITNLIIVGSGYSTNTGNGIYFVNDQLGTTLAGITISRVDVSGFGYAGIRVEADSGAFSGVSISYSAAHDNGYGGLILKGKAKTTSNLYVGHLQAYHNAGAAIKQSGYGILLEAVTDAVIERSVAYDNGWLPGNAGAAGGIQAIDCDRILIQYNESYSNHSATDGHGIVLDTTASSIAQFNYTHDNDGTGFFLGAESGWTSSNNIIRYNISQNDDRGPKPAFGGIFVWQIASAADIYNNTVFMGPAPAGAPSVISVYNWSGSSVHVRNNLFITTGGVPLVSYNGGGTDLLFQGNDYWSSGSPFQMQWLNSTFTSLDGTTGWRASTGQEMLNGTAVGYQVNPQVNDPGGGGTVSNADVLNSLTAYQLSSPSPLRQAGLDLSRFGLTWDPYGFATDPFLGRFFDPTPKDFYDSILPPSGSNLFSIGAEQITAMPANLTPIANLFTHSYEHYADLVQSDYQHYLGRTAASAEVNLWVPWLQAGMTDEWLAAGFLSSPEYRQRSGATDQAWVQSLYQTVLGRTPAQQEVNFWLHVLAGGTSQFQVALDFATSTEAETLAVKADYQHYLGRQGSAPEVTVWVYLFQHGVTNEQIEAAFVASPEYYYAALKGHGDATAWLSSVYQDILFRSPSDGEIEEWSPLLAY